MTTDERSDATRAHEEGLAAFLRPKRRARFLQSLSDDRLRRKLGDRLHHRSDDFDPRRIHRLDNHTRHALDLVHELLRARGAPPTCHVFAPGDDMDGSQVGLRQALGEYLTCGDVLLSCVPGELGLYVGEDGRPVILLVNANRP